MSRTLFFDVICLHLEQVNQFMNVFFIFVLLSLCFTEAVPKKILEMMDVPGITRENVASHLQVCT